MQISYRTSDGRLNAFSATDSLGPMDGYTLAKLDEQQTVAMQQALATPNGGINFVGGTFVVLPVTPPTPPAAPTVAPGANAGSGATTVLVSGSNDKLGLITATAGTNPAAGEVVKVTFGTSLATAPMFIALQAMNVAAGVLYATNIATTGFSLCTQNAPVAGRAYTLGWHVQG